MSTPGDLDNGRIPFTRLILKDPFGLHHIFDLPSGWPREKLEQRIGELVLDHMPAMPSSSLSWGIELQRYEP